MVKEVTYYDLVLEAVGRIKKEFGSVAEFARVIEFRMKNGERYPAPIVSNLLSIPKEGKDKKLKSLVLLEQIYARWGIKIHSKKEVVVKVFRDVE